MELTNQRIADGCRTETRAVEDTKNRLLAVELQKLLKSRPGVLNFLDNCGSVVQMKSVNEANKFTRSVISSFDETEWMLSNRTSVVAAAHSLQRRLCPESRFVEDDVLKNVTRWSFQVPPGPTFHVGVSEVRMSLVPRDQQTSDDDLSESQEHSLDQVDVSRNQTANERTESAQ